MRPLTIAIAAVVLAIGQIILANVAEAKSGAFKGQGRYDVSGQARIVKQGAGYAVKLSGFRSTSGPDLHVYVGRGGPQRRIAKLRRTSGAQTYKLPAGLTPADLSTVHIHCRRFDSTFGTARLR